MSRKRLAVVGGAIAATSVVTIVALCKGSDETAGASATSNVAPMGQAVAVDMSSTSDAGVAPLATATTELTMAPGVAAVNANLNASPTSAAGSLAMPQAAAPTATPNANSTGGVNAGLGVATVVDEKMTLVQDAAPEPKAVPVKVTPFSNGTVARGNVLKLKMDGAVESIQGASQPSGFTVVIPNRKSLEPAGPLAAQDARIAAMRVTNEAGGAELTVAFKDGVPNYQVKARGDVLEIHLAKPGQVGNKAPEAHARPHAPTKKTKHAETPVRGKHGT